MRKILFRGKTPSQEEYFDDGVWEEGFYTCFNGKEHRIYGGYAETDCGDYYPDWCNVRPETVGQYTGLIVNGKKLFEGDICRNTKTGEIVSVEWHGTMAGFVWSRQKEDCEHLFDFGALFRCFDKYEIIGNIHDNPELLKGE